MDERFIIQASEMSENWWVCTDKAHGIVCRFEHKKFNDTQKITFLYGDKFSTEKEALACATYLREMADWLLENHKDKVN